MNDETDNVWGIGNNHGVNKCIAYLTSTAADYRQMAHTASKVIQGKQSAQTLLLEKATLLEGQANHLKQFLI